MGPTHVEMSGVEPLEKANMIITLRLLERESKHQTRSERGNETLLDERGSIEGGKGNVEESKREGEMYYSTDRYTDIVLTVQRGKRKNELNISAFTIMISRVKRP